MAPFIPFEEHPYINNLSSPYYTESHRKWQKTCRAFIDEHISKHAQEWEDKGDVPLSLYYTFAKAGFLPASLPAPLPVKWMKAHGYHELPGGLKIEDYDYFHFLIFADEMARCGLSGIGGAITTGFSFGVPPFFKFGSQELQERILPDIFAGKTRICIAITEPGYVFCIDLKKIKNKINK